PVLRQIARYLPHHRSENASKTHPKSSHDKFKTASKRELEGVMPSAGVILHAVCAFCICHVVETMCTSSLQNRC
ncbi:hypothetical protein, partial [Bacteroides sp. An269]|uniref:hypothetical protein n=2 Tax=Bacteroides TaxID=816 RepID=UPI0019D1D284